MQFFVLWFNHVIEVQFSIDIAHLYVFIFYCVIVFLSFIHLINLLLIKFQANLTSCFKLNLNFACGFNASIS